MKKIIKTDFTSSQINLASTSGSETDASSFTTHGTGISVFGSGSDSIDTAEYRNASEYFSAVSEGMVASIVKAAHITHLEPLVSAKDIKRLEEEHLNLISGRKNANDKITAFKRHCVRFLYEIRKELRRAKDARNFLSKNPTPSTIDEFFERYDISGKVGQSILTALHLKGDEHVLKLPFLDIDELFIIKELPGTPELHQKGLLNAVHEMQSLIRDKRLHSETKTGAKFIELRNSLHVIETVCIRFSKEREEVVKAIKDFEKELKKYKKKCGRLWMSPKADVVAGSVALLLAGTVITLAFLVGPVIVPMLPAWGMLPGSAGIAGVGSGLFMVFGGVNHFRAKSELEEVHQYVAKHTKGAADAAKRATEISK
jgi:hypothetical protein